jgi:Putative beta-barrel porin-2, OmpL-like. bbp2
MKVGWLLLAVFGGASFAGAQQLPEAPAPAAATHTTETAEVKGFWKRWGDFYRDDWNGTAAKAAAAAPPAPRRGVPSPLDSPPFPNADWSYGGSPTIGESDGNVYPLQTAINGAKGRTKLYGWVSPSVNLSTSRDRNTPEVDDIYSNRVELEQVVVYVERLPDSVQRDHIDWGFHLTALYGTDYRETVNKGYFGDQLIVHDRQYGFDPTLEYVDVYFPHVAQGMNLRIGRFISVPGIEAQLTPNNYIFSHSLLYSVDPFTDTGAIATVRLNDQWTVQGEISASHDVAIWTPDAKPSFTGCVDHTTRSVNDDFYVCANGINNGTYAYNNLQQYDGTWYHKFNKSWHMATEAYWMYQREVPSVHGVDGQPPITPEKGTNGANCAPGEVRCFAPEWAAVNYINKELGTHDYLSLRTDFLDDKKGQRTGYAGKYSEETLSWNHWVGTTVQIRPEIRFDHAWDNTAYDVGTRRNQFTIATDVVYHF